MSPQVKVSYFGQHGGDALGHGVLYLTGVGKCRLPGSPRIFSPLRGGRLRVLGGPLSAGPVASSPHRQGTWLPQRAPIHSRTSGMGTPQYSGRQESGTVLPRVDS